MATIHFSEDIIAPVASHSSGIGGVYNTRDGNASHRTRSRSARRSPAPKLHEPDEEAGGLKRESDLKKRQDFKGWTLLW